MYREEGFNRIPLQEIGFYPGNRGHMGVSGHHVHEVAGSCIGGIKLCRYKQVDIVRVPQQSVEAWREANKLKCEPDALMPKFTHQMRYACLSKTHFTHANKLKMDSNRTFLDEGKIKITCENDTKEGQKIQEDGVQCCIYSTALWEDIDALQALMLADNDDADIEMGEDEVQAQGRVESAIDACEGYNNVTVTPETVLAEMKRKGLRAYTEDQTRAFIAFRLTVTAAIFKAFRTCVFHSVSGRVNVPSSDYKLVSTLDPRLMWIKISILIHQYMFTFAEKFPPGHVTTAFTGRSPTVTANRLRNAWIKEMESETVYIGRLEVALVRVLKHYVVQKPSADKVMAARTELFKRFGRTALKIGETLDKLTCKGKAMQKK